MPLGMPMPARRELGRLHELALLLQHFRRCKLVLVAGDDVDLDLPEGMARLEREDVGRDSSRPEDESVGARVTVRDPSGNRRDPLRESQYGNARTGAGKRGEHLVTEGVEIADMIRNLRLAVLAGHPARPYTGVCRSRTPGVLQIEAGERLRREDQPGSVAEGSEVAQKPHSELPVPVDDHPEFTS